MSKAKSKNEINWAPTPRYILRRYLLQKLLQEIEARDFVEVGPASGDILERLLTKGLQGTAVEISAKAYKLLEQKFNHTAKINLIHGDFLDLEGQFDLVLALEVLEHLSDDDAALRKFHNLLRPEGTLLLSVPAHKRKWGPCDVLSGHLRRYEKEAMVEKLTRAGFGNTQVWCYGFPLINVLKPFIELGAGVALWMDQRSRAERTKASGHSRVATGLKFLMKDRLFKPACYLQELFLDTDLGVGYLVRAEKENRTT
jgi:SAM-dependent methyltransferase